MVQTLEWTVEGVLVIDQTNLPTEESYVTCRTHEEVAAAIKDMIVRGAPAIGVAAAMGIALGVKNSRTTSGEALRPEFERICETLRVTRPTAVNLFWAIRRMQEKFASIGGQPIESIQRELIAEAQRMHAEDVAACM